MSIVSPSKMNLPHVSAGPFWSPPPTDPAHEWHELEMLLARPQSDTRSTRGARRSLHSFTLVAAALVLGGGILATTLMTSRMDCGAACHVVTAETAALQLGLDKTASLAPQPDTHVTEGRSAAESSGAAVTTAGSDDAAAATAAPEPMAVSAPRRRRHHHH